MDKPKPTIQEIMDRLKEEGFGVDKELEKGCCEDCWEYCKEGECIVKLKKEVNELRKEVDRLLKTKAYKLNE